MNLESDLHMVAEREREPQAVAIELQALGEVEFDERAVRQVMEGLVSSGRPLARPRKISPNS